MTPAAAPEHLSRALYFGRSVSRGGALFGWYHPPTGSVERATSVAICPPLGYEGICAYPALRVFAERLSEAGYPVLRFDYQGTGDSGGLDSDPDRVRAWLDSVIDAVDELRAQSGRQEVCLFGVRAGALLAAAAAAERGDVERVVLWNACVTGKSYLREMRAFRMLAEQSGEMSFKPRAEGDLSQESGGFLFSAETVADLRKLDATKLDKRVAERVLILGRDDVPQNDKLEGAIEAHGAMAASQALTGYSDMMVSPDKSVFPERVFHALLGWIDDRGLAESAPRHATSTAQEFGIVMPGVREQALRFGAEAELVGVLTQPLEPKMSRDRPLILFSNTAGNHRIGPNRMYVEMGRKLATLGFASFRIDVSGVGDSVIREDPDLNHPYSDQLFADVSAAIRQLKQMEIAERFVLAGLCSGAFVAYHVAVAEPCVSGVVLINPQTFKWEDGMSLEVNPLKAREATKYYRSKILNPEVWKKALRGGIDVRRFLTFARERAIDGARSTVARLRARMPGNLAPKSDVARTFEALTDRGTDVFIIFSSDDPGIDYLNEKVGARLSVLEKRSAFAIATIEGPDHSFTPLWAQEELDQVLVSHLTGQAYPGASRARA